MTDAMKFRAAVMHEAGKPLTIETVEAGDLQPDDALVRIHAASICHTALEVLEGELTYPVPMVLGHEAAGVVEKLGDGASGLAAGDRVILHWNPHCGHCFYCDNGQPILCETYVRNRVHGAQHDACRTTCRTTAMAGGRPRQTYGTACRQPDGSWQLVN
jgi:S-(hydroxymethyl)glutathione dehydrogenase/alcohol dehydrogenase